MRIAVNTRLLIKDRLEGIGWFTFETLKRLVEKHPEHEFIFFFDRPFSKEFVFGKNVTPVVAGPPARHPFLFLWWFEITIPGLLKKYKPDIFLSPDGYLSLSTPTSSIPVMHDLNFEHYPADLPLLVRQYYRRMFPKFAAKASRIITVSQYSAHDISSQYGVDKSLIDVAYNGANDLFSPSGEQEQAQTRNELTSGKPFLLFVGALHPRKNIINMLRAFDTYKSENEDNELQLVIVGEKMWWNSEMEQCWQSMQHKHSVIFSGRMSPEELRSTYGAAEALLYVSYFEGFGIPIIEAYRCRTPVITSDVTSMPEVAGKGALLTDPFDVSSIADAIRKIRSNPQLREELKNAGYERSRDFSWDRTAENVWGSILKVTGGNQSL